jgi:hypothetical protein
MHPSIRARSHANVPTPRRASAWLRERAILETHVTASLRRVGVWACGRVGVWACKGAGAAMLRRLVVCAPGVCGLCGLCWCVLVCVVCVGLCRWASSASLRYLRHTSLGLARPLPGGASTPRLPPPTSAILGLLGLLGLFGLPPPSTPRASLSR